MVRASVIIPVLGDPRQMEDTLVSVLENRPADCQVIVVFNQPYDDPYELAGEVDFLGAPGGTGWAECVNRAVAHSSGEIVFIVHSAVEVEPGWYEAVRDALNQPGVAAVVPTIRCRYEESRIISRGMAIRRSGSIVRRGEGRLLQASEATGRSVAADVLPEPLAGAYRRSALVAAGGFCPRLGEETAVVDLGLRLLRAGLRCVHEPACRVLARPGAAWDRRYLRRGRQHELLFWRWAAAARSPVSLARHVALWLVAVAEALTGPRHFLELCGRAIGAVEWLWRRHALRLPEETSRPCGVSSPSPIADGDGQPSHATLRGPHFRTARRPVADGTPVRRAG